jgi:hypothetical protein
LGTPILCLCCLHSVPPLVFSLHHPFPASTGRFQSPSLVFSLSHPFSAIFSPHRPFQLPLPIFSLSCPFILPPPPIFRPFFSTSSGGASFNDVLSLNIHFVIYYGTIRLVLSCHVKFRYSFNQYLVLRISTNFFFCPPSFFQASLRDKDKILFPLPISRSDCIFLLSISPLVYR